LYKGEREKVEKKVEELEKEKGLRKLKDS